MEPDTPAPAGKRKEDGKGGEWEEEAPGVVCERAMHFEYNGIVGGHSSLGVGE